MKHDTEYTCGLERFHKSIMFEEDPPASKSHPVVGIALSSRDVIYPCAQINCATV